MAVVAEEETRRRALTIEGMTCGSCAARIQRGLSKARASSGPTPTTPPGRRPSSTYSRRLGMAFSSVFVVSNSLRLRNVSFPRRTDVAAAA